MVIVSLADFAAEVKIAIDVCTGIGKATQLKIQLSPEELVESVRLKFLRLIEIRGLNGQADCKAHCESSVRGGKGFQARCVC